MARGRLRRGGRSTDGLLRLGHAQVEHVHLGFPHGVLLDDPEGALEGAGITKAARWFTLDEPGQLLDERLARFSRAAADLARLQRSGRSIGRPDRDGRA